MHASKASDLDEIIVHGFISQWIYIWSQGDKCILHQRETSWLVDRCASLASG
jgi:hypothetical protein